MTTLSSITKIVRVNGEEEFRETMINELRFVDGMVIPVGTILHHTIEVELVFNPPLVAQDPEGG